VVIEELRDHLHLDALTVTGRTLGENTEGTPCHDRDVIAAADDPIGEEAGLTVLHGNLCADGAIIKPSAASPELMQHRGRAVVFEDIDDYHDRIDDPDLDVEKDSVLVLKNVGPKGYPGMPEVGNMSLPQKLLKEGVRDMVRISDARMSGTAFGTSVLHVAPESAIGGTLALVQDGDPIELDVPGRRLHLDVSEDELARRRGAWEPPPPHSERGYVSMYLDHVMQANKGADFDFLVGQSGSAVGRANH
jgi:dihydroxy-acid dehydratase